MCSANLNCDLDLVKLCLNVRKTIYNPSKFPCLELGVKKPSKMMVKIFSTGKMTILGAYSESHSRQVALKMARISRKLGH